jgi:hypothetical protein
MGNFNKKTAKAVHVEKAAPPRPILTIPNRNDAAALTNTVLTADEDVKVANFLGLHGAVIPTGSTVDSLITAAIGGGAAPHMVGPRYSVKIGRGYRITYQVHQNNGQRQGDPMQFAITILTIGDAPYNH